MYSERPSVLDGGFVWTRTSTTPARVVPDGCMDLIWMGDSLVVAGPDTCAYVADPAPSGVFTGLRFPPGGAPSFLGVAAHELRDRHVSLDDVWSSADVRRLEERMAAAGRPDLMLERLAVGRLGGTRHPEPLLHEFVDVLRAGVPVAAASRAVGLGERQLRRRCLDAFGYGPKLLQRILRMERAVALARKDVPLAETAARAGYADQAHLARDVRALAGVTLTDLLS